MRKPLALSPASSAAMHLRDRRFRVPLKRKFGRPLWFAIAPIKVVCTLDSESSFLKFGHTDYAPSRVQEKRALARVCGGVPLVHRVYRMVYHLAANRLPYSLFSVNHWYTTTS